MRGARLEAQSRLLGAEALERGSRQSCPGGEQGCQAQEAPIQARVRILATGWRGRRLAGGAGGERVWGVWGDAQEGVAVHLCCGLLLRGREVRGAQGLARRPRVWGKAPGSGGDHVQGCWLPGSATASDRTRRPPCSHRACVLGTSRPALS